MLYYVMSYNVILYYTILHDLHLYVHTLSGLPPICGMVSEAFHYVGGAFETKIMITTIYVCIYIYIYIYIHIHLSLSLYIYIYMYMCVCVYIYIYIICVTDQPNNTHSYNQHMKRRKHSTHKNTIQTTMSQISADDLDFLSNGQAGVFDLDVTDQIRYSQSPYQDYPY